MCLNSHHALLVLYRHLSLCICMYMFSCMCVDMWAGSNVEASGQHQVFSSTLSTLFPETKSLAESGAHKFSNASWPMSQPHVGPFCLFLPSTGFLYKCWRIQTWTSRKQTLCWATPVPGPQRHLLTSQSQSVIPENAITDKTRCGNGGQGEWKHGSVYTWKPMAKQMGDDLEDVNPGKRYRASPHWLAMSLERRRILTCVKQSQTTALHEPPHSCPHHTQTPSQRSSGFHLLYWILSVWRWPW